MFLFIETLPYSSFNILQLIIFTINWTKKMSKSLLYDLCLSRNRYLSMFSNFVSSKRQVGRSFKKSLLPKIFILTRLTWKKYQKAMSKIGIQLFL
jgi:hypothetical protein